MRRTASGNWSTRRSPSPSLSQRHAVAPSPSFTSSGSYVVTFPVLSRLLLAVHEAVAAGTSRSPPPVDRGWVVPVGSSTGSSLVSW